METKKLKDLSEAYGTTEDAEQGHEHELSQSPGVFITVIGADSDEYQRAARKLTSKRMNDFAKRRKFSADLDREQEEELELLVLATKSWRTVVEDGKSELAVAIKGVRYDFTPQNVRKVYTIAPGIREEMVEVMRDRSNFLPKPASGS